jgi:thymidylate kinase
MQAHIQKYPQMQPADMVKMLYQSEYAGGHLITDPAGSLSRLILECRGLKARAAKHAFEDIGGGLYRLHLAALSALGLEPQTLNRLFVATANTAKGSTQSFSNKLDTFLASCRSGEQFFNFADAEAYVRNYRAQGCPPVSHSSAYRAAYAPAYRVVKAAYCRYIEVFRCIDTLLDDKASVTVAIDGSSGAGKSSLAALLAEVYDCNVFHTDDFFLPTARKTAQRLAEPGGNVDHERLKSEVIQGLKRGEPVAYRRYDCRKGTLGELILTVPKRLNVVEGVYSLHPALDMSYDLSIFLKTGGETQQARIRARSGDALLTRFVEEWIPLENRYFDALDIEQKCGIIYDGKFLLDENMAACI